MQRQYTKFLLNDYVSDIKSRLIQSDLLPLTYRREYLDLVFAFNAFTDLNDFNMESIVVFNDPINIRNNAYVLCKLC